MTDTRTRTEEGQARYTWNILKSQKIKICSKNDETMSKEQRTTSNELLLTKSRTTQESKQIMIVMNYNPLNKIRIY